MYPAVIWLTFNQTHKLLHHEKGDNTGEHPQSDRKVVTSMLVRVTVIGRFGVRVSVIGRCIACV